MLFSSPVFLFLFLPFVLLINQLLNLKASNVFLLLTSLFFYYYSEGELLLLLLGSITINYSGAILIDYVEGKTLRKFFLGLFVMFNLLLLVYYKYSGFLAESFSIDFTGKVSEMLLPLGISFFTFQGISYLVDVYRKDVKAEINPLTIGLFISYFPQLIAGPIIKYKEIKAYFKQRSTNVDAITSGSILFIKGLGKKVIIADNLAIISDQIFAENPSELSSPVAWLGILVYGLQILFDFSAYSNMAIALGKIMGFKIPENFNYPYISKSVREFWRRWHISLSTWFRDYLYLPLGGNRKTKSRTYVNLLIVFFITGLWHGASWNFVMWGLFHGFFMMIERMSFTKSIGLPSIFSNIYTLLVVGLSWVLFRCVDFETAINYYSALFRFSLKGNYDTILYLNPFFIFIIAIAIILSTPLPQKLLTSFNLNKKFALTSYVASFILLILSLAEVMTSDYQPFIYFKF